MIERIVTRAIAEAGRSSHTAVRVVAGAGIVGDRYFGCHDEPGQNLTLIEAEEIERFASVHGRALDAAITGRNLVTRGIRLNALVGREFTVGAVRLRGVELCEPCRGFGEALSTPDLPAPDVVRAFVHRAGLRADVLSDGEIRVGDVVATE